MFLFGAESIGAELVGAEQAAHDLAINGLGAVLCARVAHQPCARRSGGRHNRCAFAGQRRRDQRMAVSVVRRYGQVCVHDRFSEKG